MNQISSDTQNHRLLFFDNIRYLMIISVIVLHAAASYAITKWWYVYDAKDGEIILAIPTTVVDTFAMSSIEKKGAFLSQF